MDIRVSVARIVSQRSVLAFFAVLVVVISNWYAVVSLETIILDDQSRYYFIVMNEFPTQLITRLPVSVLIDWGMHHLTVIDPRVARGVVLLFFMVPLALSLFWLYCEHLDFPPSLAFFAAVIPTVLPGQTLVPTFINGSYIVHGALFVVLSMQFFLRYVRGGSRRWLFAACVMYLVAVLDVIQAVLLCPAIVVLLFARREGMKRFWLAASACVVIGSGKIVMMKLFPLSSIEKPVWQSLGSIIHRLGRAMEWMLPFPADAKMPFVYLGGICLLVVLGLAARIVAGRRDSGHGSPRDALMLYTFFVVWVVSSSFVFIIMTRHFSSRHLYLAAFGLIALLLLAVWDLTNRMGKGRVTLVLFFVVLIVSVYYRNENLHNEFERRNREHRLIRPALQSVDMTPNAQVLLVNGAFHSGGWWVWSSGYLKFATGRKDIDGQTGREQQYFDPFNPEARGYTAEARYGGLDPDRPLYVYRMQRSEGRLDHVPYVLEWDNGNSRHSPWRIRKADPVSGALETYAEGTGWEEYCAAMERLKADGFAPERMVFGGPPDEKTIRALGLEPADIACYRDVVD